MGKPVEKLTIAEVCAELQISRSTFYEWKSKGKAPCGQKLPNGEYRIKRSDFDEWYEKLEAA
jgi:excisionase family DNA binding protein